jgi:AAA15 family ATPase/GTPase
MLIEFSLSNYRSFRERQTFSMVAASRLHKKENTFKPIVKGEKLPALLKLVAIYGPNASGKSNLIKALGVIKTIAHRSPNAQSDLPVMPFRFDPLLATKPSRFEIHFIKDALRYQFDLAVTKERIVEERLTAFPNGKASVLYERIYDGKVDDYRFGTKLEGGKELHNAWRQLTGPKSLFISQAVANSSEELQQLRAPFAWLKKGLFDPDLRSWANSTQDLLQGEPYGTKHITSFLQSLDVPVTRLRFESLDGLGAVLRQNRSEFGESIEENIKPILKTVFTHKTALGEADFDFEEESDGTKGLIGFWLPWLMLENDRSFGVLVIDELDSSLHPKIVASLVEKHLTYENPAQLIFSAHDTHLMDTKLLRRDQFWLTERDANGATTLRSIYEFEGREGEDLEKRYYEGRYRGLPIVRRD